MSADIKTSSTSSLYDRLGGIFGIAAVISRFSDQILLNKKVGYHSENEDLREWSLVHSPDRLPGLKWMRTLWLAAQAGGPYPYVPTRPGCKDQYDLQNAHCPLKIQDDEFDAVAKELEDALDYYDVKQADKNTVMEVFRAHKQQVTRGYNDNPSGVCPFACGGATMQQATAMPTEQQQQFSAMMGTEGGMAADTSDINSSFVSFFS